MDCNGQGHVNDTLGLGGADKVDFVWKQREAFYLPSSSHGAVPRRSNHPSSCRSSAILRIVQSVTVGRK
jgi:hypothetical protein